MRASMTNLSLCESFLGLSILFPSYQTARDPTVLLAPHILCFALTPQFYFNSHIETCLHWAWWCTFFIPALGRQRQVDLYEFEASLVYQASSRTARTIDRNLVWKNKPKTKKPKKPKKPKNQKTKKPKTNKQTPQNNKTPLCSTFLSDSVTTTQGSLVGLHSRSQSITDAETIGDAAYEFAHWILFSFLLQPRLSCSGTGLSIAGWALLSPTSVKTVSQTWP